MSSFWKGIQSDEHIWEHEWSKHGTCVSTLEPECYGDDYVETEEVIDYFAKAVEIFQTLPTYYVRFFTKYEGPSLRSTAVAQRCWNRP